jgi:hypothetical protein
MSDIFEGFGVAKFGKDAVTGPAWKRRKLAVPEFSKGEEATTFVCRIVPPIKSLKGTNYYYQYHDEFWGYEGRSTKDPAKTWSRPFVVKNARLDSNPAQRKIDEMTKRKEDLVASLKAAGKTEDEIELETASYGLWIKKHNRDTKVFLNVVDEQENLHVLMLSSTNFKKLKSKIDKMAEGDEGVNALDPRGGVWFKFTRTDAKGAQDDIEIVTETQTVPGFGKVAVTKAAPMSAELAARVLEKAPDLRLDVVKYLTLDQATRLVYGPEDPDFVDAIWAEGKPLAAPPVAKSAEDELFSKFEV